MWKRAAVLVILFLFVMTAYAEETIAVRVGNRTFTRTQVQRYINQSAVTMEMVTGGKVSDAFSGKKEEEEYIRMAAEHFVTIGVLREKLAENGLETLTAEEDEALRDFARTYFEEIWQRFSSELAQAYPDTDYPESFVTEIMVEAGYSMDDLYETGLLRLQEQRLIDLYCADIGVTEEEAKAYYAENFVEPDREKYQENLAQFEIDTILLGASSSYVPDGFCYVRALVFEPNEERRNAIEQAEYAVEDCSSAFDEAAEALTQAALAENADLDAVRTAYRAAQEKLEQAQAELAAVQRAAAEDYEPLMELIHAALADGASFETVMEMYGDAEDNEAMGADGYPFHPQSSIWDQDFIKPVSQLKAEGDITGPFYAGGKVYIVRRGADIPGGAHDPGAENIETIRMELLYERQTERLNELAEEWAKDMDIETDLTGLLFPKY